MLTLSIDLPSRDRPRPRLAFPGPAVPPATSAQSQVSTPAESGLPVLIPFANSSKPASPAISPLTITSRRVIPFSSNSSSSSSSSSSILLSSNLNRSSTGLDFRDFSQAKDHSCCRPYWVLDGILAGMPLPCCADCLKRLVEGGVGLLVSLIESKDGYLPDEWMQQAGIQQLKLPLRDHTVPTMDNVKTFLDAARKTIASGKAVTVHCLRGCGRTAVFLACYLVVERRYHPERAIDKIKAVQPEAFSTLQQELYVWDVWRELVPEDDS